MEANTDAHNHESSHEPSEQLDEIELVLAERENKRDFKVLLAAVLAGTAVAASLIATFVAAHAVDRADKRTVAAGPGATKSAPNSAMVHLADLKFEPTAVTLVQGGSLQIMNTGAIAHNVAVQATSTASPMVSPGGTETLALGALAPGKYTLYCQVPGHLQAGMKAALTVVGSSSSAAASSTPKAMNAAEMDAVMAKSIKAFPAKTAGVGAQVLAPTVLADGTKEFDLTASIVRWEVEPGKFVDAWTYNAAVPGPTLMVNPRDKVKVVIKNNLPESTAIHFHGLITPNSQDGVPEITQPPIKPGETFTYAFTAQATPAVGMYHSHQDAVKQVPNGLAGAFLVGEEPIPAGITIAQTQIMMLNDAGTLGFSLNGKSFPATAPIVAKLGDWFVVHYMNEGQSVHPMHLHGFAQRVIAKDGYPVPQPYDADTILVGPGERYTVLVHADQAGVWAWHCHILSHAENDTGMFGMVTALIVKGA
jgi:FtsP/CotA-like multicopper oxidase with cupredoxin domain